MKKAKNPSVARLVAQMRKPWIPTLAAILGMPERTLMGIVYRYAVHHRVWPVIEAFAKDGELAAREMAEKMNITPKQAA